MIQNLLLLDGNSMLFRAYYATLYTHRMSTSNGIPTNAVYGFIMMLNKAVEQIQPDAILVAWDAGKKTFRHEKFDAYKGTRKPLDEDLIVQFPIVREFLDAAGISRYEIEGYEADDIIGSLSKYCPDIHTTILTSDRDLLQLIDDSTRVLLMKKGITDMELMDSNSFQEKFLLEPLQIIDLKGLMGDASDNIPGVAGVGEKTATKLLQEYQSVENVYENIDKIKGKLKEKLEKDKDKAFLSKELATIYTKMEFPFDVNSLIFQGYAKELPNFFTKYEMRSFLKQESVSKQEVFSLKSVQTWPIKDTKNVLLIPVHTLGPFLEQRLYGFMTCDQETVYYISLEDAREDPTFLKVLEKEKTIRTWDSKELNHLLDRYGFPTITCQEDWHLASFLLHSQATDIDALCTSLEIHLPESFHELSKKSKTQEAYALDRMIPVMQAFTQQLFQKQDSILEALKENHLLSLYEMIEKPLVPILYEMEKEGILVNEATLQEIDENISSKIEVYTQEIYQYAQMPFNINSPKQLATVLFDELNLKPGGKKRSTSAEVLEKLKGSHPIIDALLEYRKYSKIKSTYIEGLKKHIQEDHKIHTTFHQTITQTGRLSSSDPNLQNISVKDEEGREIRRAFQAPEGFTLLSADYSQIELRILAHMANEANMIQAFKEDADIHTRTASYIFDCEPSSVTDSMRRIAKTVNFGIVYGQTEFGLSQQLKISRKEAASFMETYFATYPNIHTFMNSLIDFCQEHGYVETLFHRQRQIPEINDKNFMTREFGKRAAMNAPIQGTAADLIKVAMIKVDQAMKEKQVRSKMLLQIHDELIFLVPNDELEMMKDLVQTTMNTAMDLRVPLKASLAYGQTWYEAK